MLYFLYKLLWALDEMHSMATYRIPTTRLLSGGQGTLQNNRVFPQLVVNGVFLKWIINSANLVNH